MRLLLCLAERSGEVVSIDELIEQVWSGVNVTPDSVYQAVASLRRLLGDDAKQPTYIATVPRLGYRMVATVSARVDQSRAETSSANSLGKKRRRRGSGVGANFFLAAAGTLCIMFAVAFLLSGKRGIHRSAPPLPAQPKRSVAVLPFLDLTDQMDRGPFADGMTEELIDRLSKIPGFRVPSPTSSFYFRDKQVPLPDIAKLLGVSYVLDGSVRKSGTWLRVDVRLIRADSGYVLWSETYDRPVTNVLAIQDDIAGRVTKALQTSIEAEPIRNE